VQAIGKREDMLPILMGKKPPNGSGGSTDGPPLLDA
jgi:hypothetical protein